MSLPTGIITFLLTDIQGSTRLWEEHPDAMGVALARHDDLAATVISHHNGILVKRRGEGDSLFAVFPLASNAVAAACALQVALAQEPFPEEIPMKVRIALHTGEAEMRDGDYYGSVVNRCARLRSAAHGGQVLISAATQELIRDTLPDNANVKFLGEHRLKDLAGAQPIYQVCHASLPDDFLPIRSLDNPELPNNLPQQVTSFIGREKELGEIRLLMEKSRLVTLTGSGGSGKTRLAVQTAVDALDSLEDGAWMIELAALSDAALVLQSIAGALGIREEPSKDIAQTLVDSLKTKQLLIVLDNCEHLLDACARMADAILRQCPNVAILATSREGLGISGELMYRVPSLTLPDLKQDATPESLAQFEAVALFIERAQFQQPDFAMTAQNTPAVASICCRLDGIPLAIELAAARVRSLSVEEVNQRLDQRFRLLTGGSRTALPRQQTLRSLIDWSYDLLNEAERALLRRLSVFSGGWVVDAAEQVCSGGVVDHWHVVEILTSLVDKSLVVTKQREGYTRYRLLETVRQYALDRLLESGEGEQWRDHHLEWCIGFAERTETLLNGPDQRQWMDRLDIEHDNFRSALEWGRNNPDVEATGLRLAGALWRFWHMRGRYMGEGRQWLASMLSVPSNRTGGAIRARALNGAGNLAFLQTDYSAANAYHHESLSIKRAMGDRAGVAISLNNLGNVSQTQADYASARILYNESLAIKRELGDRQGIIASLSNLGNVANAQGDYAAARALHEECRAMRNEAGDRYGVGASLNNLGNVALGEMDYAAAQSLYLESISNTREIDDRLGIAISLQGLGAVAAGLQNPERAARIWGAEERLREEIGAPIPLNERPDYEQRLNVSRSQLNNECAFEIAWQEGRTMTFQQAIGYVCECPRVQHI
jgi:predicted ATPase/class 3 adenylate cyclase